MTRAPRNSLRRRLTTLCSLLTLLALALTGFDSYRRERATQATNMQDRLGTLARMAAMNSRTMLEFDYVDELAKFLQTVVNTMDLQAAAVYGQNGKRVAVVGDARSVPEHMSTPLPPHDDWLGQCQVRCEPIDRPHFDGTVLVRASGLPMRARLRDFLLGQLVTGALALLVLGVAAKWLLTRMLQPVANLVETTHRVRESEDYSLRAHTVADDEIGSLVHAFNAMLQAIQERDRHLAGNAERLEQQVVERTAELSRALATAETATRAKSTFVANMSHEIRTPLNAVLGMTELAMESEDPRELREYLGVIRSAGSNLLGILCDILDLSKIESEKLELSPVATEIETLLLDALRPLTSRIQSKNLELSFELAPDLAAAYLVDDVRLRQILTNLVGNAIKFTSVGHVDVRVRRRSVTGEVHEIEITVQDSGVGIPSDRLQAIFSPFTQADNTITRRFAGTGLGLSITDRLVRLMGGMIRVESEVGRGTTFTVLLPLPVCHSPLPPPPKLPATTRLVLVSASAAQAHTLTTIGRRLGIEVRAVTALAQVRANGQLRPGDFLLLDERDPDRDAEACDAVPANPLGVRPLLVVTSFQDLASASARCRANQFAGYITKPISARELAVRLSHLAQEQPGGDGKTGDPAPAAPEVDRRNRLRILVAEDNAVNQKLIERILQRDGHQVRIAENGRVCCELWQREQFDLVLMDMQMPEMSGLEATAQIRREEANSGRRIPIIALTANTTPEDRRSCLHAGMDEVLPKPVSIQRLRGLLTQMANDPDHNIARPAERAGEP